MGRMNKQFYFHGSPSNGENTATNVFDGLEEKVYKDFFPLIQQTIYHLAWFAKSGDGKERTIVFTLFIAVVVIMQIVLMVIVH